jgi:hypothetical protein
MNRKQLITLLVLVLVVGGAGLLVYKNQVAGRREGNLTLGQKLLPNLPVNDVTRIGVKQGTNEVNLVKKDDLWRVRERGDYPANFGEISGFLLKARDLKILESEQVGASQLPRLGFADAGTNNPVVVDLRGQNDKEINKLLLGKKHMRKSSRPSPMGELGGDEGFPDGRYVKVGEKSDKVVLISDPLENIKPTPQDWLSKDFIKVEKIRSVAVTFPQETNSWKVARETDGGEWKLADAKPGEQLDSSKASGLNYLLSSPSFTDVVVGSDPAELGLDKPTTVSIETFDNFVYTIKAGSKTNDNYPISINVEANLPKERKAGENEKPEDKAKLDKEFQENQKKQQEKLAKDRQFDKWVYLVSTWTLDSALKNRSELMTEKKEEKPADSADPADHSGHAHEDEPPLPQSAVPVPEAPSTP